LLAWVIKSDINHISNSEISGKNNLTKNLKNVKIIITTNERKKMSVATATYKVGDLYTSQKSKVTGTITEIKPNTSGTSVRVKLDVEGKPRWTTWTAK
jgi:hypothetical protein